MAGTVIKIKLVASPIGAPQKHKLIVKGSACGK